MEDGSWAVSSILWFSMLGSRRRRRSLSDGTTRLASLGAIVVGEGAVVDEEGGQNRALRTVLRYLA